MRFVARAIAPILLVFGAGTLWAQTLYKQVDKDGRVTYTDKPPADSTGKVTKVPIDQAKLLAPAPKEETEYEKIIRRKAPEKDHSEVKAAQERLEKAGQALQAAQDSTNPEDWIYRGKVGGGTLRYPKPEYVERLARLEADVKAAEENLAEAERRHR